MQSTDRTNLLLWRWQRRTAVLLLPLVAFHVVYQYFIVGMEKINFTHVAGKLAMAGFVALDIALLIVVAAHAFIGVRSIAIDYTSSPAGMRAVMAVSVLLFAATVAYAVAALAAFL